MPHNIKLIQGFTISFWRNRQDRMRNRFRASFRMAENAKRTPELTRKVKNCNVPRNKIKSAIFWQKSYRLEWYLIICHYLKFICALYQFHHQTPPIMKIDRGQIQFRDYVFTGTEPKF